MPRLEPPLYPRHDRAKVGRIMRDCRPWCNVDYPYQIDPLSEVVIRVVRAYGMAYLKRFPDSAVLSHADFWRSVSSELHADGFGFLATFATAIASYAAGGEHPRHYIADVIDRARQHARNRSRGRPWVKAT